MQNKLIVKKNPYPKGEDGHKTFSIRIKDETLQDLERIAGQTGRSRNELINLFLEYAIDNSEIEN